MGKPKMWFPNRSDTNRPVRAQKRARSLKYRIEVEEALYYPSSDNKGADQLRSYCEADLRLCFRLCRLLVTHVAAQLILPFFDKTWFYSLIRHQCCISSLTHIWRMDFPIIIIWMSPLSLCLPPTGSGDILFFPVRLSVRSSVCLSVRHKSCPLYNLKTVKDFSMKLGTFVNHDETMCHAQEP